VFYFIGSIIKFFQDFSSSFENSLVVLEATGGYEMEVIHFLQSKKIPVHRANARHVKNFIRSYGILGKSDGIDALALALYGAERHVKLKLYRVEIGATQITLRQLQERRTDLIRMRSSEKNRLQAPNIMKTVLQGIQKVIDCLDNQIESIDNEIGILFEKNPVLDKMQKALMEIPGIATISARALICLMPELGTINAKKVASLGGLAPHPNESGGHKGYRRIRGGRVEIRAILFINALTAGRSKSHLGDCYRSMKERGKKPRVAVIAIMRRMLVIANAKARDVLRSFESKAA
jgi:transposase